MLDPDALTFTEDDLVDRKTRRRFWLGVAVFLTGFLSLIAYALVF